MTLIASDVARIGNWLKYEFEPELKICRKTVTVNDATAATYNTGLVLVPTLISGAGTTAAVTGNTSVSTATITIADANAARVGVYLLKARTTGSTGTFDLYYPDGSYIGSGAQGTAFTGGGLTFTLTAGTGTLTAGDAYTITVTGTEKYSAVKANSVLKNAVIFVSDVLGSTSLVVAASTDVSNVVVLWRGVAMVADGGLTYGSDVDTAAEQGAVNAVLEAKGILIAPQL